MDNNVIIKEAQTYISNDKTLSETATILGVSKRTLQLHFKKLDSIDSKLSLLVKKKKEKNQVMGRIKGGTIGKVSSKYSREEILVIAKAIIKDELTYEDASEIFDIPKSTVYELVHNNSLPQEVRDSLELVAYANQRNLLVSELGRRNGK